MKKQLLCAIALLMSAHLVAQEEFKIICGPYLQNMQEDEVTVMWITNRDAVGWVEIAPDDSVHFYAETRPAFYQSINGRKTIGRLHRVRVSGLEAGTSYRYRVISREVTRNEDYFVQYGQAVGSDVFLHAPYRFTTFESDPSSVRCTIVNDIHGKNDLQKALLSRVPDSATDFVFFNGDMANHLSSEQQIVDDFLKTASETFAAETPFFFSRGNHETRGRLAYEFLNYFPTPSGRPYYTFQNGPAYFIVLDGGEDKPDNDIEYHGLGDYDRYRNEEARWLQEIVQSEAFRQAAFRIVLMHVTPVNDSWHGALETRQKFVPILNGHGIDLMLCGHTHQAYYAPAGENGCDFPLLINAPDQAVDLDISDRQLTLTVRDSQHRTIKTLNFPTKK